jgi:recombination protein RecT
MIRQLMPKVKDLLPKHLTPERMMRVSLNAMVRNPKLLQCSTLSVCNAIVTCSEFGLEPNTPLGLAHIIPYGNVATFQIGYPGLLELAHRSGRVEFDVPQCVHEHDTFEYSLGLKPDLKHIPNRTQRGDVIGYYAVARVQGSDTPKFVYMSRADVEAHARRFSKAYAQKGGPWETNFDAMAKKTAMIALCKWLPRSIEGALEKAIAIDTAADQGIDPRSMGLDAIDVDGASEPVSKADALAEKLAKRGPGRPPKTEAPKRPADPLADAWNLAGICCEKHGATLEQFRDYMRERELVPEDATAYEINAAIDAMESDYANMSTSLPGVE